MLNKKINNWFVYMLKCGDYSIYTGSTNDLEKRVKTHSSGKGAKYTRSHLPVELVYSEELTDRSSAAKRESEIKKLSRKEKIILMQKKQKNKSKSSRHKNIVASYLILKQESKILMLRRFNTGFKDGQYSLVAGHVDDGETFTDALIREAREESGLEILPEQVKTVHIMHRCSDFDGSQRVDVFHLVEDFVGEPKNVEPHKCDDLSWFEIDTLPDNTIPYIRVALDHFKNNVLYSEHGW